MLNKFLFFALVGSIGTLAHYSVLYTLVEHHGFEPVIASSCGAFVGLIINYGLNFKYTFNSNASHKHTFPKFASVALLGIGLNTLLMGLLTIHIYYLYAQVLTTFLVLIWTFAANSIWTFKMAHSTQLADKRLFLNFSHSNPLLRLLLLLLGIRVATLGFYPLYDPSESRYAEMARKMLETGNWVTPFIDYHIPFWGKPPLTVWLTSMSLAIGGLNDFFARLPSTLLGIGIIWLIFHLVKMQKNTEQAYSSSIILASSVLFFVMSGTVAMDQCLTFGITLTLTAFWLAVREKKTSIGYLLFIGLSIGLLAKGPIAIVLSGITIGLWTLSTGRWQETWQNIPWLTGSLLMLCITLPWYLLAERATPGFLEYFIIGEHWKRFTESGWKGDLYGVGRQHAKGTIWLYWLGAAFPWSLVLIGKLFTALKQKQGRMLFYGDDNDWRLYCACWMLSPLLFFTLSANIIWTYVLPGLPGMALLLADWIDVKQKFRTTLTLCVPIAFLALVMLYHVPNVEFFKSQQSLVDSFKQQATQDERLIYYKNKPYSAQFYLQGKVSLITEEEDLQALLATPTHDFFILDKNDLDKLTDIPKSHLVKVRSYAKYILLHANQGKL